MAERVRVISRDAYPRGDSLNSVNRESYGATGGEGRFPENRGKTCAQVSQTLSSRSLSSPPSSRFTITEGEIIIRPKVGRNYSKAIVNVGIVESVTIFHPATFHLSPPVPGPDFTILSTRQRIHRGTYERARARY